jgi:hypothetical protein
MARDGGFASSAGKSNMDPYRIYQLNIVGKPIGPPVDVMCQNDVDALKVAGRMSSDAGSVVEIWQDRRLVAQEPQVP